VHRAASGGGVGSSCFFLTCVFWGQVGHNNETSRADDLLSGFGWLRGVHEGGQRGQRQGAEVPRAGEV